MADRNHSGDAMMQAEVGGGARIDGGRRLQRPGYLIRDFIANSVDGRKIQISDYRGQANLVLVFAGKSAPSRQLVKALAEQIQQFAEQDSVILVILPPGMEVPEWFQPSGKSLVLLPDEDGKLHQQYGAVEELGRAVPVIYVTDRYGEILSVFQTFNGEPLPDPEELLKLLEFLNRQCPECEPPEWPR